MQLEPNAGSSSVSVTNCNTCPRVIVPLLPPVDCGYKDGSNEAASSDYSLLLEMTYRKIFLSVILNLESR